MMTMDRIDWDTVKTIRDMQHPRAIDMAAQRAEQSLTRLHQAAVSADKLMADPNWAVYQQMLQAQMERVIASRDTMLSQLMSDQCSSFEAMTRVKRVIAECEATIRTLAAAIELPKQIVASGRDAERQLAEIACRFEAEVNKGAGHG